MKSGSYAIDEQDCWIWLRSIGSHGYGEIKVKGKRYLAHRYSYELHKGEIPEGKFVLHICDVKRCINPDHLFLGTQVDNMKDKVKKGRQGRPGLNPVTEDEEAFIFFYRSKGLTYAEIATLMGLSIPTVGRYLRKERTNGKT